MCCVGVFVSVGCAWLVWGFRCVFAGFGFLNDGALGEIVCASCVGIKGAECYVI